MRRDGGLSERERRSERERDHGTVTWRERKRRAIKIVILYVPLY